MSKLTLYSRWLAAIAGVALLAACAQPQQQTMNQSPQPHQPQQQPQPVGGWYQVMFETNKADITPTGQAIVNNVATAASTDNALRVTVIGKTDRVGSQAANMKLSEQRANHVRNALIATGKVPANRIDTRWIGERKQDVPTANDVAEQRNRVVDITVQ